MSKDIKKDFNDGLVFSDQDDIFSRGHVTQCANTVSEIRIKKIKERAEFSQYLLLPTKYRFPATVRIYGYVICFVRKARKGREMMGQLLKEASIWFSVFNCDTPALKSWIAQKKSILWIQLIPHK